MNSVMVWPHAPEVALPTFSSLGEAEQAYILTEVAIHVLTTAAVARRGV